MGAAAGGVQNPEGLDFQSGFVFHQRAQGMADQVPDKGKGGVIRAGPLAGDARNEMELPGRQAARHFQGGAAFEGFFLFSLVVITLVLLRVVLDGFCQGFKTGALNVLRVCREQKPLLVDDPFGVFGRNHIILPLEADLQKRVRGKAGFVFQEALVNVAEVFDVQLPEGYPFPADPGRAKKWRRVGIQNNMRIQPEKRHSSLFCR
jgi:hypothetical protein